MTARPQETPMVAADLTSAAAIGPVAAAPSWGEAAATGSTGDYVDTGGVEVGDLISSGCAFYEVTGFSPEGRVVLSGPVNSGADGGLW